MPRRSANAACVRLLASRRSRILRPMNSLVFPISQIRLLQYCGIYFMRLRPFKPFRRLAKALCENERSCRNKREQTAEGTPDAHTSRRRAEMPLMREILEQLEERR